MPTRHPVEFEPSSQQHQFSAAISAKKAALLLLLFDVKRDFSKLWAVLVQLKLFATSLSKHCVVVLTGFLANEEGGFLFFLRFGHDDLEILLKMNLLPGSSKLSRDKYRTESRFYESRIMTTGESFRYPEFTELDQMSTMEDESYSRHKFLFT